MLLAKSFRIIVRAAAAPSPLRGEGWGEAVALSSATSIIEDGMDKNQIANLLDQIATLLELKEGSSPFEVRAYQNAARAINALDGNIEQLPREAKLKAVPGLGPPLVKHAKKPMDTGHIAFYDELASTTPP